MTSLSGSHDTHTAKDARGRQDSIYVRLLVTGVRCALGISDDIFTADDVTSVYQSLTGSWSRHQDDGQRGAGGEDVQQGEQPPHPQPAESGDDVHQEEQPSNPQPFNSGEDVLQEELPIHPQPAGSGEELLQEKLLLYQQTVQCGEGLSQEQKPPFLQSSKNGEKLSQDEQTLNQHTVGSEEGLLQEEEPPHLQHSESGVEGLKEQPPNLQHIEHGKESLQKEHPANTQPSESVGELGLLQEEQAVQQQTVECREGLLQREPPPSQKPSKRGEKSLKEKQPPNQQHIKHGEEFLHKKKPAHPQPYVTRQPDVQIRREPPGEGLDEVDGSTLGLNVQNAPCAADTDIGNSPDSPDVSGTWGGKGAAHADEDLVIDGPLDGASDEWDQTILVNQQYQDPNGGFTTINVHVQKLVVGAGTSLQIGSGNTCFHGRQTQDDSSGSSDEWVEEESSSEESSPPSTPSSDQDTDHSRGQREGLTTTSPRSNVSHRAPASQRDRTDQNSNYRAPETRSRAPEPRSRAPTQDLQRGESLQPGHVTPVCDVKVTLEINDDDLEETFPVTNMFVDVSEDMFVGRENQLKELGISLDRHKVAAVSGMGGSGKTTFACLYAYRNTRKYKNGIFFVDASNINTLPFNFAALAGPGMLNLVPRPDEDVATSTKLVAAWLAKNSNYLLIYDAADDLKTLDKLGKQTSWNDDCRYIPPRMLLRGHVLVTSRCPGRKLDPLKVMCPIILEDLGLNDTCTFLWRRVHGGRQPEPEEIVDLENLVRGDVLPGRLPLHLEQTASYIRRQNLTFGEYGEEARRRKERNPLGPTCFGDNRKTIDDAFVANFEAVAETSPEAAMLLNMAALCHSRNIPFSLFSVGALALTRAETIPDENIGDLIDHLMTDIVEDELFGKEVFERTSAAGRRAVRELLEVPDESQLVKFARGGPEFTVHEVIQEQLRLRMKEQNEMVPALVALANILLFMMKSDDVSLLNKRLFLAHAEKCAEYMCHFGPTDPDEDQYEVPFSHLYFRLRAKTAFVFALLGSFPTAHEIVADLEKRMPRQNNDLLRVELLGLKARICVWQHKPNEGLLYGVQGLELLRFGDGLGNHSDPYLLIEYAFMRKSCAHALISLFETENRDVSNHLAEAKRVFELLMESSSINCQEEYSHLLMLHGLLHRNVAARHPDPRRRQEELRYACGWLRQALETMDAKNYLIETCKTHLHLVEFDLGYKSVDEVVDSLKACRDALDAKLGRYHRYTAWVLGKMARILIDTGRVSEALEMVQESLKIQDNVYGKDAGMVQMGQTKLLEGEALILMSQPREAVKALEDAERLLENTPKNPAYAQVERKLREARDLTSLPQAASPSSRVPGGQGLLQGKPQYVEVKPQYAGVSPQYAGVNPKYAGGNPQYPQYAGGKLQYAEVNHSKYGSERSGFSSGGQDLSDPAQESLSIELPVMSGGSGKSGASRRERWPAVNDDRGSCDYMYSHRGGGGQKCRQAQEQGMEGDHDHWSARAPVFSPSLAH